MAKWYAASAVMYFRLKRSVQQTEFVAWENVYLVKASSVGEARQKARRYAKAASGDDGGDLTVDGKPATLVFGGLRKVVECIGDPTTFQRNDVIRLHDGVEATYSSFVVRSRKELDRLIRGKPAMVLYKD